MVQKYIQKKKYLKELNKKRQGFDGYCARDFVRPDSIRKNKVPPVGAYNPKPLYKIPVLRVYHKENYKNDPGMTAFFLYNNNNNKFNYEEKRRPSTAFKAKKIEISTFGGADSLQVIPSSNYSNRHKVHSALNCQKLVKPNKYLFYLFL